MRRAWRAASSGDLAAKDELVAANLGLVYALAKRYADAAYRSRTSFRRVRRAPRR
jgi:DNA-directed RNA polymerase sigma subunit (sigma70/sigma32)